MANAFDYRPTPITLTAEELETMRLQIETGQLPPDAIAQHFDCVQKNVFGFDFKKDRNGKPIENGLGSARNQTRNSVESYRKWGIGEADYEINLQRMEKELAVANERRKREREAAVEAVR